MKNRLFELIREEKIILFAGAGTSLDAGYPMGDSLQEILYNTLKTSEKKLIQKTLPLKDFTEEFCRIKDDNRKTLNMILRNQFQYKRPLTLKWHKELSLISHIKTIITTNYDTLFEDGYGKKSALLFNSSHVSKSVGCQTEIYKVHGDLTDLKSIIITSSDYNRFFKDNSENSIFWSAVKTQMATNNILFIGYNLEDSNINVIFEKIYDELGNENQKEHFLLAPNLPEHRIKDLKKKGISYINMKSGAFLNELKEHLEQNVIEDFHSQKIKEETFINFARNYGMMPKFDTVGDRFKVLDFEGINAPISRNIHIQLSNKQDFEKQLSKYMSSDSFYAFEITKEKILSSTFCYGKLSINRGSLEKIKLTPVPEIETIVDICFDNGVEYFDIQAQLYKRNDFVEIKAKFKCSTTILKFDLSNVTRKFQLNYDHKPLCGRLKDEIEEMEVYKSLSNGREITISSKGYKSIIDRLPGDKGFADYIEFCLEFFKKLKIVENLFNVKFENIPFGSLDSKKSDLLELIIKAKKGNSIEKFWDGELQFILSEDARDNIEIRQLIIDSEDAVYPSPEEDIIELYQHKFNLGYRLTQLIEPYISNPQELITDLSDKAIFKSKAKKILIRWTNEQINDLNINEK
jgi:NAD-dependent SIR2 family protein deacetylase